MSRLEDLIAKLCPDGVEYIPIGDVVNYEQPTKYIVSSTEYDENYETPVLTAGQTFILGYTNEKDNIYPASKDNPVIIFDDFTGAFKWVDFPFKVKSSAMKLLHINTDKTTLRYIYHVMGMLNFKSDEHKRLWIGIYSTFEIPFPPIEVQREIVRILDSFTELTAELQSELQSELQARKQQYEYYRDMLLQFSENETRPDNWVKLSEVANIGDGLHGTPPYKDNSNFYFINGNNIQHGGIKITNETKQVDKGTYYKYLVSFDKNTVLMSINGTIGNVGMYDGQQVILGKSVAYFIVFSNKIFPKYLFYYLQTSISKKYYEANATGGTIKNLGLKALRQYKIFLPPLEVQQRIVSILDRFDALCNDLTSGIPAEIEARQKQYEYYRDKLLNFKRKQAGA